MHACMYVRIYVCMYAYMCVYACMYLSISFGPRLDLAGCPTCGPEWSSRAIHALQIAIVSTLASCQLANFLSAFWAPCKAPKYTVSISFLIARRYFGRLARRPKALKKFASANARKLR